MPEVVMGFGEQRVLEFYYSFLNRESYPRSKKLAAALEGQKMELLKLKSSRIRLHPRY